MGLGGTYRLGEDFKVIIWGASHKGLGPFFIGGIDPSKYQVKIFIWQLEEVKNGSRERFYISCNFSNLLFDEILLAKLKNLYNKYARI